MAHVQRLKEIMTKFIREKDISYEETDEIWRAFRSYLKNHDPDLDRFFAG